MGEASIDLNKNQNRNFRDAMKTEDNSYADVRRNFKVIENKRNPKIEKTVMGGVAILTAAATIAATVTKLVQSNNIGEEYLNKISYIESARSIGGLNLTKITGVTLNEVIRLDELIVELYKLKKDENVDKNTILKKAKEALNIELKIIHEKLNLIYGAKQYPTVGEGYNGNIYINVGEKTAFRNNEIPGSLKNAIHCTAQMDDFHYYKWDERKNKIQQIIDSLIAVENIIMDKIYLNEKGELEEIKAPTNKQEKLAGKREEQKEIIIKYLEEGYTTYAENSSGNYVKVIENSKYLGGCDKYDNPYPGLIDEYYNRPEVFEIGKNTSNPVIKIDVNMDEWCL